MIVYDNVYSFDDIQEYMMKEALGIETNETNVSNQFSYEIKGKEIIDFFQKIFENKTLDIQIKIK